MNYPSRDLLIAGKRDRVEAVNSRIQRVAKREKQPLLTEVVQPLFAGQSLRENLMIDGVHLNLTGRQMYRSSLLKAIHRRNLYRF